MKNIFKVTFVIIGTIIGAGFASGQEIYMFFNRFGIKGILGILVSTILTGIIIARTFKIVRKHNISSYKEFLKIISKTKNIDNVINIIIQIFLIISFFIMVAGFSAYFKQEFNIPIYISSIVMAVLCCITLGKDISGVISINSILIPVLIGFISYLGIRNIEFTYQNLFVQNNIEVLNSSSIFYNWFVSSILYASYNSIMLIPMLIELEKLIDSNKKITITSLLCTIILSLLGICIYCLLLRGGGYVSELELPLIEVVKEFGSAFEWIYGAGILFAIFTSAISIGYSFLKNCTNTQKNYRKLNLIICVASVLVANIGFAKLVAMLYPVFGVLGLIQVLTICKK